MLKIRRLKRYRTAKYPRRKYVPKVPVPAGELIRRGGVSLLLLALIENLGCENPFGGGSGVTGPPPVRADLITENEARQIIMPVFTDNGISLDEDYRLAFQPNEPDSTILYIDGYNDSLRVGYEYFTEQDDDTFTPLVKSALVDSLNANGPYIKTVGSITDNPYNREGLELIIEAFIDTLKAHGII